MKDWILRLLRAVTLRGKATAQTAWAELPGHLTAATVIEAIVTGDTTWVCAAIFLLVMLAILRR